MAEDGFATRTALTPTKSALVLGDDARTFAELDDRASRLAAVLAAAGVVADDRVAVMCPNGFELFEGWLAAAKLDALVVLVNWHLKADELAYILADSQAKVLLVHPALAAAAARARHEAPGCAALVVGEEYEAALAAVRVPVEAAAEALAPPVFYTSGTTGRPKGVVHGRASSEAMTVGQRGQVALWGWSADDVNLLCGPAYHAGPGGYAMTALFVGATTVIMPEWDAREWLRLVEAHRVTICFMTPAHFIRLLEVSEADRDRYDLSSLRLIVHAGAPCPIAVKERILDALAPTPIWELYGASEGGATRISPEEWRARPGSVGLPWPGVEVRVVDDDGHVLGADETGLVYVRPAGGRRFHYHDDVEKTSAAWRDGAFTVGDIGHLDVDGFLYLTDRASDMVIRGGVNVYPREIEEILFAHPAVVDCAVFGVPDERLGEQLKAMVEVREATTPEALRTWCVERIADFKVPAFVEIVDELPRHPNGKVLKRALREQHWTARDHKIG